MKKAFLFTIVILSLTSIINAQEIQFGAKAGLNFANLSGDFSDISGRTSFHLGATAELEILEEFSIQPELLFSSQGAKDENQTLIANYLHLPIMGKYLVTDKLSVEVGPQIGYLLSATIDNGQSDAGGGNTIGTTVVMLSAVSAQRPREDVKEFANDFDFGVNLGLGYKIDDKFHVSARYNIGLTDGDNIANNSLGLKNSVIQLSVGYLFL